MKKIFVAILFLLTIFLTAACGIFGEPKKIIIGVDDEFPPMCFHDERGELVGFDIDLAKETAKRMGVDVEFKPIDWNKKREAITSGDIDIIWNGLDITAEYKEYMIFSKPYMDNRQILMIKRGNPAGINSEGDLAGKIVGVQAGSNSEEYINAHAEMKNTFARFVTYRNVTAGFEALSNGELDVMIVDEIAARYEMSKRPKIFETVEVTIGSVTKFGIGFRKDDTALRDRVQKSFDEMIRDGTAKKISEHWFQADLIKSRR